ncbi:MAG TPA: hypothetical protein VKB41_13745 [Steroidobacteraceae bacterium]|jgi:hypothetical protein|nr:hypothetical protein [Steroidobacteraceae bacterium]
MSEKSESDEYEEDEGEEPAEPSEDLDVDHLIKDLESMKRRGPKVTDPAWRRLERYMEDKRTSEQLSDFDDYDIGREDGEAIPRRRKKKH